MKRLRCFVLAAAVLAVGAVASRPALADDLDPSITLGSSTTGPGTAETFSWSYTATVIGDTISFLNNSGTTWTSLEIVGDYSTSGHTFTCNTSTVFNTCPAVAVAATTATFDYSGGTGVANGSYLTFEWTNWNTNSDSSLPTFNFTANGGGPTAAPEPSSIAMLGIGLLGLLGLTGFGIRRRGVKGYSLATEA